MRNKSQATLAEIEQYDLDKSEEVVRNAGGLAVGVVFNEKGKEFFSPLVEYDVGQYLVELHGGVMVELCEAHIRHEKEIQAIIDSVPKS
jgi:hypothetical protein